MLFFCLFHLFFQPTLTQHNHESISLLIDKPKTLNDQYPSGVTPTRPAFFGFPQYLQGSLTGVVVYATPSDRQACHPLFGSWPKTDFILMVDRGNCTFVTKVKNAEAVGAIACIVVDNIDEFTLPYMADDGTGQEIMIPSLFIAKSDGENIKKAMNDSQVILQLNWFMPKPDDRVEWEFWHVPDDVVSKNFIQSFQKVAESLGSHVAFNPHYFIFDGSEIGCLPVEGQLPCGDDCTNSGRYCYITSHFHFSTLIDLNVTGAAIVEESIRQLCLWKIVNQTKDEPLWWEYVLQFEKECWEPDRETRKTCSSNLVRKLFNSKINLAVFQCVTDSGNYGHLIDSENTIAEEEIKLHHEKHIRFIPTVRVNEIEYRGSLMCHAPVKESTCGVLSTICAGFSDDTMPEDCDTCGIERVMDICGVCELLNSPDFNSSCIGCDGIPNSAAVLDDCGICLGPGRDVCGQCYPVGHPKRINSIGNCPDSTSGIKPVAVVIFSLLSVIIVGCGVYFYLQRQKIAMREDVDSLLKQYLPMDTENLDRNSGNENTIVMLPMLEENPENNGQELR